MSQLSDLELDIQTKLLRATFIHNLAFFQQQMPELYEFYKDYKTDKVKLTIDHNGDTNLVSNGNLMYPDSPQKNSQLQVEAYINNPQQFVNVLNFSRSSVFKHSEQLKALYDYRKDKINTPDSVNLLKLGDQIDFMTMIGLGMGYQLEELFNRIDIRYFYLWEPDADVFHCAMHIVDFRSLYKKCENLSGALTIKIGGNENHFVNEIEQRLQSIGHFNMARLYMYRHYNSEETDKGFKNLTELCYRLSNGWGFFEDEVISVSHTLTAVDKKLPLLKAPESFTCELENSPVFIIGNGPSLDAHLEYIKANQDNAIIFSCGTTLKAILDAGIMPDFHIEMERVAATYEWIDKVGHKDKLKQIKIIALNTVYSEIYNLFGDAYIIPKPKDGGMDFLYEFISEAEYPGVYACNPTVTNAAAAISIRLGFKQLYLFGVDYGYKDESKHHSKGSMYYQKGFHGFTEKMESAFKVKGNFCESVYTTQIFDVARASLELLLQSSPEVTCINCSDGAYIHLTESLSVSNVSKKVEIIDKSQKIDTLLSAAFSDEVYGKINFNTKFSSKIQEFEKVITLLAESCKTDVNNRRELGRLFSNQYDFIKQFKEQKETNVYYRFLDGTLNYCQSNIMANVFYFIDEKQKLDYINWALEHFADHLKWLILELIQNYNKPSKI